MRVCIINSKDLICTPITVLASTDALNSPFIISVGQGDLIVGSRYQAGHHSSMGSGIDDLEMILGGITCPG